eukprot:TRINITY_DN4513_c2_g1_i1.p1 TRINITY_DN4513_c2_g1~~TRINITY_DN4513_c2_g1_i1.p1  ORF type:complete len:761 (-),score=380.70 TRINITY_DN4513_c2_g1_i1:39-2240(-)
MRTAALVVVGALVPAALAGGDACGACTRAQRHLVRALHTAAPESDVLLAARKFRGDIKNLCSDAPNDAHSGAYEVLMSEATTAALAKVPEIASARCPELSGDAERAQCRDIAAAMPRVHGPRGLVMTDLLTQHPLAYGAESETCALMGRCGEIANADTVPDMLLSVRSTRAGAGWTAPSHHGDNTADTAAARSRGSFLATTARQQPTAARIALQESITQRAHEIDGSVGATGPAGGSGGSGEAGEAGGSGAEPGAEAGDNAAPADDVASTDGLETTETTMPRVTSLPLLPGASRLGVGYSSYGRYLSPESIFKSTFAHGTDRVSFSTWRTPGSNAFYFASRWYKVPDHLTVIPCAAFEQGFHASEVFDRDARSGGYGGSGDVGVSDMGDVFGGKASGEGSLSHSVERQSDAKVDDKLIIMSKYAVQARLAMDFPVSSLNAAFVRDLRAAAGYESEDQYVSGFFSVWGDRVVSRRIYGGVLREHATDDTASESYDRQTKGSGTIGGKGIVEGAKVDGSVSGNFNDHRQEESRTSDSLKRFSIYGGPPGLSGELQNADMSTLNTLFNKHPYAIVSCSDEVTKFIPRTAEFSRARSMLTKGISEAGKRLSAFRRAFDDVTAHVERVRDAYRVIKDYDNRAWAGAHEKLTGTKLKAVLNRCAALKTKVAAARAKLQKLGQLVGSSVGELYLEGLLTGEKACAGKIAHWDAYPSDFTKRSVGWCLGSSTFWKCTPGTE